MALRHTRKEQFMCRKLPGVNVGLVCDEHDGRCVICDSFTQMVTMVKVCDECSFGPQGSKCIVCGSSRATQPAFYCRYCVALEKDRDGCPQVVNMSQQKRDAHHKQATVQLK